MESFEKHNQTIFQSNQWRIDLFEDFLRECTIVRRTSKTSLSTENDNKYLSIDNSSPMDFANDQGRTHCSDIQQVNKER